MIFNLLFFCSNYFHKANLVIQSGILKISFHIHLIYSYINQILISIKQIDLVQKMPKLQEQLQKKTDQTNYRKNISKANQKMQLDQQTLADRIKQFLASNSQFRNPKFDPAPFLIQILKQKQSDHEAILQRRKQLIELQNDAYDLIEQVCAQYADDFLNLLSAPQKQAEQLQKLRSNMSVVKKKTRQTKSLLINTQKDIDQTYLNCIYNKLIYKKLKEVELKLYQYECASLALKNNQFLNCSLNLPSFKGYSILESALVTKAENLKLQLLSKGIEEVSLFVYLTPKIVLPTSQSLIERISSEQTIFGNLKKHQGFHKRYNLFKRAHCVEYLPTLWNFKELQMKKGKIHLMYDVIKGVMNIGKIQQILQSLQLECKKSVQSIFLLLQFYFSLDIQQEKKQKKEKKKGFNSQKQQESGWFLCKKGDQHYKFISVVLDVTGVIIRKLVIMRLILKQFQIPTDELSNLQCYTFFEIILKELNQLFQSIYVKEETQNVDYIHEEILKKIKTPDDYILWPNVRNLLIKSLIIIDQNISMTEEQHQLSSHKMISKPKWDQTVKIDEFDKAFSKKFHIEFMKTLQSIFNHEGKSFAFESLELITSTKPLDESEISFCRYFSSQQMKYSKEYVFTISLLGEVCRYFTSSNFNPTQCKKYQLYILSVMYLKLNYYLQRNFINNKTLQRAYNLRKTSSKLKTREKDFKRKFDKICIKKKFQVMIRPWKKTSNEDVEQSKYRVVENLKGVEKQNQMLFTYCSKVMADVQKYKESQSAISQIGVFDKLEPTNYDENFSSKLIRIWDQLPQIDTSIGELTLSMFQKFIQLHMVIGAVIYLESSTD